METHEVSPHVISLGHPALTIALPGRRGILMSFFTSACLVPQTQTVGSLSYQSSSKTVEFIHPCLLASADQNPNDGREPSLIYPRQK